MLTSSIIRQRGTFNQHVCPAAASHAYTDASALSVLGLGTSKVIAASAAGTSKTGQRDECHGWDVDCPGAVAVPAMAAVKGPHLPQHSMMMQCSKQANTVVHVTTHRIVIIPATLSSLAPTLRTLDYVQSAVLSCCTNRCQQLPLIIADPDT